MGLEGSKCYSIVKFFSCKVLTHLSLSRQLLKIVGTDIHLANGMLIQIAVVVYQLAIAIGKLVFY